MPDLDPLVTLATRHHDALGGLAALLAATIEGFTAAERDTRLGGLLRGVAALVDQQREQAAAVLQLTEDVADRVDGSREPLRAPRNDDRPLPRVSDRQ